MLSSKRQNKSVGFTLIEVMMVIVLLGFMASVVQYTITGNSPEDRLEKTAMRFNSVFSVAADYALLNNVELGLVIHENTYQFVAFDGGKWIDVPENELLAEYTLPESILVSIELDDLPIEEPQLIDTLVEVMNDDESTLFEGMDIGRDEDEEFTNEDQTDDEQAEDGTDPRRGAQTEKKPKKKIDPQVFILSGGDISPFSLDFYFDEFDVETDELSYRVTGMYSTPLTVTGPLYDGAPKK